MEQVAALESPVASPVSVQLSRWTRADRIGSAPEEVRPEDQVPTGGLHQCESVQIGSYRISLLGPTDEDGASLSGDSWTSLDPLLHEEGSDTCMRGQTGQVEAWETFQVCLSEDGCTHATCTPLRNVEPVVSVDVATVLGDQDAVHVQDTTQRAGGDVPLHENVEMMRAEMCKSLSPLLSIPPNHASAVQTRNPRKKRGVYVTPRRSARLAKHGASKQQQVLITKLCLAHEGEVFSEEALRMNVDLFSRPLSDAHIAKVLALSGWESPAVPLEGVEMH